MPFRKNIKYPECEITSGACFESTRTRKLLTKNIYQDYKIALRDSLLMIHLDIWLTGYYIWEKCFLS